MSSRFFEVEKGFLHNGAAILAGQGLPGTGDSAEVGIGSVWLNTSDGSFYIKKANGSGFDKWKRIILENELSLGSWREPVVVADFTSTTIPSGTPGQSITVDGIEIVDGNRVLFAGTTDVGQRNIWIYNQLTGTFVEDENAESVGDIVYIKEGTHAGKTLIFNNQSSWVQISSSELSEQGYIRSFIGKDIQGNELPSYSSVNFVANGDNLETAIGKLDLNLKQISDNLSAEITNRTNSETLLQNEIDNINIGAGLDNGTYFPNLSTNYISTATSLKSADDLLDAQLKSVEDFTQYLDKRLNQARTEVSVSNVTSEIIIDSVDTKTVSLTKWIVFVEGSALADKTNKKSFEVLAIHNGTATSDATEVDYTQYAVLNLGSINGLSVSVNIEGTGSSQKMNLIASSIMAVDIKVIREVILNY